jgi:hypothetical protein
MTLAICNLVKWNIFHNYHISANTSPLVFPKEEGFYFLLQVVFKDTLYFSMFRDDAIGVCGGGGV